ncbi:MAG TPA: hypothetical protein VK673_12400 [Chthoniobacterales bacterium]|nr:hypothetical protein [Chthoniobacterales bacterium]
MRCPLCGKAGIRLVAFTDAAGALHMIGAGPSHAIPHENSPSTPSITLDSCVPAKPSLDTLGCTPVHRFVGNTPRLKLGDTCSPSRLVNPTTAS